ncbi:hypothetical protein TOPH_03402 [Tolypocladium ophioglossoides CBS 100239]|uniref:Uncharacterized protein n=1 Tax=Tolypocladium ophioglossoides (strain CBS 100239) TaxID=1163406 RepID=A0A0L0ND41_TOLOC|nr:hypothetical protein TOPH_03402 [Tolypocladium ophioglossoides CBS 100239]
MSRCELGTVGSTGLAIANGADFILYFFLASETRYVLDTQRLAHLVLIQRLFAFRRIHPKLLTWFDFVSPLTLILRACAAIPAAAYAMIFLRGSIMTMRRSRKDSPRIGLQDIGIIIGTLVGERVASRSAALPQKWMLLPERRGKAPLPGFRLWLSYIAYVLTVCGVAIFFVQIDGRLIRGMLPPWLERTSRPRATRL